MKKEMIVLIGGGDTMVKIVPHRTLEWIYSEPNFPTGETGYTENIPPEFCDVNKPEETMCDITTGSWDNDRALQMPGIEFDSIQAALQHAAENGWTIIETYEGYIY